jgi:hypothetical protein
VEAETDVEGYRYDKIFSITKMKKNIKTSLTSGINFTSLRTFIFGLVTFFKLKLYLDILKNLNLPETIKR